MYIARKKTSLMFCISTLTLISGCTWFSNKTVDVSMPNKWTVSIDPTTAKAHNEYDVIVVGSGIGWLSCASFLAKNGVKVLVLEQNAHVGGYCSSYERNGFTFQAGAHDISGVENGMISMLLDTLGLNKDDLFVMHTRTYTLGTKTFTLTGTKDNVIKKLSEAFPHENQSIKAFFDEAEKALTELTATRRDPTKAKPTYDAWSAVNYQQKLDEFFHDPELKKFLCSLLGYLGTTPKNTIAVNALMGNLRYFIYGGHYPKKGGQAFADALKIFIETHGGTVLTNTTVDEILVAHNQITGVRAGNQTYLSSIVIANANAKTTFKKLLPPDALDPLFINAINNLKMSISIAMVNLGVDLDLSNLSSIIDINSPELKFDFIVNSNADHSTAPAGMASISRLEDASYADTPASGTPAYARYKEELITGTIAKLEKVIPGIGAHIIVKDVITPRTFEHYTSMPEGAIYSFDQSKGSKRPYFKTPIKGLYSASASTLPGGGVEAVVASGFICAQDILSTIKKFN